MNNNLSVLQLRLLRPRIGGKAIAGDQSRVSMQSDGGKERGCHSPAATVKPASQQPGMKVKGSLPALALLHMIYNPRLITKHNFL